MKLFIPLGIIAPTIIGCDNSKQIDKRQRIKQFDLQLLRVKKIGGILGRSTYGQY